MQVLVCCLLCILLTCHRALANCSSSQCTLIPLGGTYSIDCHVGRTSYRSVAWFISPCSGGERRQLDVLGDSSLSQDEDTPAILDVKNFNRTYQGNYTCELDNSGDERQAGCAMLIGTTTSPTMSPTTDTTVSGLTTEGTMSPIETIDMTVQGLTTEEHMSAATIATTEDMKIAVISTLAAILLLIFVISGIVIVTLIARKLDQKKVNSSSESVSENESKIKPQDYSSTSSATIVLSDYIFQNIKDTVVIVPETLMESGQLPADHSLRPVSSGQPPADHSLRPVSIISEQGHGEVELSNEFNSQPSNI